MNAYGAAFLAALAAATATRLWLGARQLRHVSAHRGRVPEAFCGAIALEAHQKAADYSLATARFGMACAVLDALVAAALTFGGGLAWLDTLAARVSPAGLGRGLALIGATALLVAALEVPLDYYRVFAIEERFGFNRMTRSLFFLDLAKRAGLAAALGLPLAAGVLALMERGGAFWWVWAWALWAAFNLAMIVLYPVAIAPLFNRFSPLEDAAVRERAERLLARCGLRAGQLLVMDGSRRSAHGNAYFTGFGRARRVVLFDTLLARLDPPEVEAVLAHELGHYRLRHVAKRMGWALAVAFAMFAALAAVARDPDFYAGLAAVAPSNAMALVLAAIAIPPFAFALAPAAAAYSRRHEFEADRYAAAHASGAELAAALVKLYRDNATTLTPDPLYSAFYDSHPPAVARIARLQKG